MDCPGVDPNKTAQLVDKASVFNDRLEKYKGESDRDYFAEAKDVAIAFKDEALALPQDEQLCLLKNAQRINNEHRLDNDDLPHVNIVFSNSTGKLAKFELSYLHIGSNIPFSSFFGYNSVSNRETVDLFSP